MAGLKFMWFIFVLIPFIYCQNESCDTAFKTPGTCVVIERCPKFRELLNKYRQNPTVQNILRKSICGFNGDVPKICCPSKTDATTTTTTEKSKEDLVSLSKMEKTAGNEEFVVNFPEPPICGFSNGSLNKVVGGDDAKLGDLPWMALLGYRVRTGDSPWLCGGTLITELHVLTAAHCIRNYEQRLYIVRLGELDWSTNDDNAKPFDIPIKNMKPHEKYNPNPVQNDIGILVLQHAAPFTDLVRPICMPLENNMRQQSFADYTPFIAGWGATETGLSSPRLQIAQLTVNNNEKCSEIYKNYKNVIIDNRIMCAQKPGKDSCKGDSGGPLMQPLSKAGAFKYYFYQIGVISFGLRRCATEGMPSVYTRVTEYIPWIRTNVLGAA